MPDKFELQALAVPAVTLLITFLAYSSQVLLPLLEPGPLTSGQKWKFNALVSCIWLTYCRAITVDPGRVAQEWSTSEAGKNEASHLRQRYCRRCEAPKPPRSHHCKICKRCIPKMDHHCPWTSNCVSHFTFPHFLRFLFYAVSSMAYLEYFLWIRAAAIWRNRNLPSYLGPTAGQLGFLFVLIIVNTLTVFAVSVIFFRSTYDLCCNTTTIETWEIDRHEQLLRRARVLGGFLDGPDGVRVKIVRQEFPYDIGIWNNIGQGMGTSNVLAWFWPFSATPKTDGIHFETNGFEDPGTTWPPPDPDRMPRLQRQPQVSAAFVYDSEHATPEQDLDMFKLRQAKDYQDRHVLRRKAFHQRFDSETYEALPDTGLDASEESGEEGWQDTGGSRLKDYGVDEAVEFYDEENMPLAELIQRRRNGRKS